MREPPFNSKQGQKIYIKIYMDFMLNIYLHDFYSKDSILSVIFYTTIRRLSHSLQHKLVDQLWGVGGRGDMVYYPPNIFCL